MKLAPKRLLAKRNRTAIVAVCILLSSQVHSRKISKTNMTAPPVFWNVFKATAQKDQVTLTWIVTEYNNKVFYIQHSLNATDWTTIDSVETKNSPLTLDEYNYTCTNKQEGRHYYRVKQVDIDLVKDGYSEVVTVVLKKTRESNQQPGIALWPNPATDQLRVINENDKQAYYSKAFIYDLSGKKIAEKRAGDHTNVFSVKDLPAGIYLVQVQNDDGTYFTRKMIKQ
ncbi:MAG: T9SS type A sorting domain-containing protein [Chitinophagaceae bacterium]|nr:T9SS type A sorting domain-containing protein [Chitinophagaceae bacterium]